MEKIEEIERKISYYEKQIDVFEIELEIATYYLSTLTKDDADYEKAVREEICCINVIEGYWHDLKKARSYLSKLKGEN